MDIVKSYLYYVGSFSSFSFLINIISIGYYNIHITNNSNQTITHFILN